MNRNFFRYKLNIYLMYGYWFFHNLIFAYVIERLYWASKGITNQQVIYTEIIYASVVIFLEVPTGALADRWSKKMLMIFAAVFSLLEFLILIYAESFYHFALAVSVAAVNKALSSGTSNAIIFESLKIMGKSDSFEKVSGRVNFFDYMAGMLAALIGSYVAYKSNYVTTYWLSLISMLISVAFTLLLKEPFSIYRAEEKTNYFAYIKDAFFFLKEQKTIRFVLLFGIIIGAIFTYIDEFWQIYVNAIHIPIFLFGVVSSTRMISGSLAGLYAYKIKDRFSYDTVFSILLFIFVISIGSVSYISSFWGLIPLILSFVAFRIVEPLVLGYLHHRTESRIRATVESFQSLILRGITILVGLIFGYFSTKYSIFIGFRVLAFILCCYAVYFFFFKITANSTSMKTLAGKKAEFP